MKAVVLENLSKTYPGGKKAVDRVSISLEQGEVFGFLGPNGAGKTTTVKLLNGMLTPTGGSCRVFGMDPGQAPEKVHAISGVVTEHAQMYDHLTGLENLMFYGSAFGMSPKKSRQKSEELLTRLELTKAGDRKLGTYSTGMRQRLSLARALLHSPKLLFLDEPTAGLDPESAQNVHGMIRQLAREQGITVFLCTHQLRYAQEICTNYGLLEEGRLLALGSLEELRSRVYAGVTVTVRAKGIPEKWIRKKEEGPDLAARECFLRKAGPDLYEADVASKEEIPALVRRIVAAEALVYHISAEPPSLEEIYFALTGKGKEEKK